jgi:exosortase/archaeosortase family protein
VPFTKGVAHAPGAPFNLRQNVTTTGTVISSPRFGVNINNGCNGVEAMLILLASIVAFRLAEGARGGLVLGAIAVQLNAVRIVTLISRRVPAASVHVPRRRLADPDHPLGHRLLPALSTRCPE